MPTKEPHQTRTCDESHGRLSTRERLLSGTLSSPCSTSAIQPFTGLALHNNSKNILSVLAHECTSAVVAFLAKSASGTDSRTMMAARKARTSLLSNITTLACRAPPPSLTLLIGWVIVCHAVSGLSGLVRNGQRAAVPKRIVRFCRQHAATQHAIGMHGHARASLSAAVMHSTR